MATSQSISPGELSSHSGEALVARIAEARERIWLASPFVSDLFAQTICDQLPKGANLDLKLLVALNGSGVESRTLSLSALGKMVRSGFELSNTPNLHAKLSVIDSDWGIVGSGNLTAAGQHALNVELGVRLTDDQVASAAGYFSAWWSESTPVEPSDVKSFREWAKSLPSKTSNPKPPKHGKPLRVPAHQRTRTRTPDFPRNYWVKAMYHAPHYETEEWWRDFDYVHDAPGRPKGGPTYAAGDLMLIYLRGPGMCTAIARVESPARFDPVAANKGIPRDERGRWPWRTRVQVLQAVALEKAISPKDVGFNPVALQNGRIRISREQFEIAQTRLTS